MIILIVGRWHRALHWRPLCGPSAFISVGCIPGYFIISILAILGLICASNSQCLYTSGGLTWGFDCFACVGSWDKPLTSDRSVHDSLGLTGLKRQSEPPMCCYDSRTQIKISRIESLGSGSEYQAVALQLLFPRGLWQQSLIFPPLLR